MFNHVGVAMVAYPFERLGGPNRPSKEHVFVNCNFKNFKIHLLRIEVSLLYIYIYGNVDKKHIMVHEIPQLVVPTNVSKI